MFNKANPDQWGEAVGLLAAAFLSAGFSGSVLCGISTYLVGWIAGIFGRHIAQARCKKGSLDGRGS